MDTLTHGLLGAVTAQLGFRQRIGRDATWVAAGAAVLPDLDIFISPVLSLSGAEVDDFTYATVHRGLSHSLLIAPVLSAVVAFGWWWFRRRVAAGNRRNPPGLPGPETHSSPRFASFRLLFACIFVTVVSHVLLDWTTSYGTLLFSPLSNARLTLDAMPILDMIYTPLLILTLAACYWVRKITPRRAVATTLVIGWVGFLLGVGYIGAGRMMHDKAVNRALRLVDRSRVRRADAFPAIGTIFLWRVIVETDDAWLAARVHLFANPGPIRASRVPKAPADPWLDKARQLPQVRVFNWFAMGRVRAEVRCLDGRHIVEFHDVRYGLSPESLESLWPLRVTYDQAGQLVRVERVFYHGRGGFPRLIKQMWQDIWNP